MKTLSKTTFIVGILMLAVSLQPSYAQQINMERMNRDINIMENILQEMFKSETPFHTVGFSFNDDGIRGGYLPGYGIIFMIPDRSNGLVIFTRDEDGDNSPGYRFKYSTGSEGDKVTEESVVSRISEFLRGYASAIGQISRNDKVTVVYNSSPEHQTFTIMSGDGERITDYDLPTISVTAKAGDLQVYRSGDISQEEFNQRLQISKTQANDGGPLDLKVMATIFETALDEGEGKSFQVSGSVDYLYLDNFGALFSFEAEYGDEGIFGFNIEAMRKKLEELPSFNLKEIKIEINKTDTVKNEDKEDEIEALDERDQEQAEHKAAVLEAYQQFKQRLKQYLVDYGRTLNSVAVNQHILVTVNIESSVDEVPERLDLQLEKSVLEQMDEGDISREEAISEIRIRVREY